MRSYSGTSLQFRVWARPEAVDAGHLDYALDIGARILTFFEDFYDVPYPLPKLGGWSKESNGRGSEVDQAGPWGSSFVLN